ncbi:hypothetical protein C8R46DRAFT_1275905 [Mycena filopes]|nr:hypothetical protein C8R46DRAFT_1275905 [Mycena filopes]
MLDHAFLTVPINECVRADWPLHKVICKKAFTSKTAASTAVVVNRTAIGQGLRILAKPFTPPTCASRQCSIRTCAPGYKRSLALKRQVLLLQQNPSIDYFLCLTTTTDKNLFFVYIPDDAISTRFRRARDEVMSTGDMESLGYVVEVLLEASQGLRKSWAYSDGDLVSQMQKEYSARQVGADRHSSVTVAPIHDMAAYAAVPLRLPAMQDALTQPERWNLHWENTTRSVDRVKPSVLVDSMAEEISAIQLDSSLLEHQAILSNLRYTQTMLTVDAAKYFAEHDLEKRWMEAGPDLRGKHILIGLADACSIARNLHDARLYCDRELRLAHLRTDGRTLLDLLKAVTFPVETILQRGMPEEPTLLPHPAWDDFAAAQARGSPNDREKFALASIRTLRTKLICHVIHSTLNSFLGMKLPEVAVSKYSKKKNPGEPALGREFATALAQSTFGVEGARAQAKENKAAWKARQRGRKQYCSYDACSKANAKEEDSNVKFARCKSCWEKMQREILYCSVECQTADWKPHHKAICGKPLTFEAVSKPPPLAPRTTPTVVPQIGPPIGNYKRSRRLASQVAWLNANPKVDYALTEVPGHLPTNLDFPDPEAHALFRKCRDKAMTTGDKQSIAVMAHFICWMNWGARPEAKPFVPEAKAIVTQLKQEYEFEELGKAVAEMQQRQNRDPFRRPPLLAGMAPQSWVKFCQGMDVNRQVILD